MARSASTPRAASACSAASARRTVAAATTARVEGIADTEATRWSVATDLRYRRCDELARCRATARARREVEPPDRAVAARDRRGVDGHPPRSLARAQLDAAGYAAGCRWR